MSSFANLTAIVTGGAGGLGAAIAAALAAEGARVIVADRDAAAAEAVAAAIPRAVAGPLDVTDEAQWAELFDRAETQFGGVDVLVNNAGIYVPNVPFEDMSLSLWRRHIAVNLDGTFLGCREALRRMKAGGAIVNMGSGMSIRANPMGSAYCASKAGVLMTTRTAARAGGRKGIRVNCVLPGPIETPMLMGNVTDGEGPSDFLDRMRDNAALGILADANDIARAVLFLASPANAAITGIYLPVDGGNLPGA